MAKYEKRMRQHEGDDMMIIRETVLEGTEKRVVNITHDESTFYCCEGKPIMWMEILLAKHAERRCQKSCEGRVLQSEKSFIIAVLAMCFPMSKIS